MKNAPLPKHLAQRLTEQQLGLWNRCTDFQRRVYLATAAIPRGETRSYRWVAQRIGQPRAARAVGQALGRNPFLPAIPCHRVIRADGSIGGYARGLRAKRRLLTAERALRLQTTDYRP
jgi:O-6-methylguanine DNA methyltransferase